MSKTITRIELDGKIIGSKPLLFDETVSSIRVKLKERTKNINYQFLDTDGNTVETQDEKDYNLSDIIVDKKIKIVSVKNEELIKIFLNDKEFGAKSISQLQNLYEVRDYLKKEINQDFVFLDLDSCYIEKEDEKDYSIKDIINNETIYLKSEKTLEQNLQSKIESKPNKSCLGPPPSVTKSKFDLSKYKEIQNNEFYMENLKLYRYSQKKGEKKYDGVFEYFYDDFDLNDYKEAYVVFFWGKIGDGKTTAINAFFNIVKGIKLEDNFRFLLISKNEKKEKEKKVEETYCINLYYLKDYNNKPIIIIDFKGFGYYSRGLKYDEILIKAFSYVFSDIINHINVSCFIINATNNRIDTISKYIFSSIANLFSEEIWENFIFLATFANRETMKKGPSWIESINKDVSFSFLNKRMDNNYWYAFDSKSLFDDDIDLKLTKYSYEQISKLYEEKIKKLNPKSMKESTLVINQRITFKTEVNSLITKIKELRIEQNNLKQKEKLINELNIKFEDLEKRNKTLYDFNNSLNKYKSEDEFKKMNDDLNQKLNQLGNEPRVLKRKKLVADKNNQYTHCDECLENCHDPCDCWLSFTSRCKIFPIFQNKCERCGHSKNFHRQDYYHYIYVEETEEELDEIKEKPLKRQNKNFQGHINEWQYNKEKLLEEKRKNENEKRIIEKKMVENNRMIKIIILKIQELSQKMYDIEMNKYHIQNKNDFIDYQISLYEEIGCKGEEFKELKDYKKRNELLKNINHISPEELLMITDNELMDKIEELII